MRGGFRRTLTEPRRVYLPISHSPSRSLPNGTAMANHQSTTPHPPHIHALWGLPYITCTQNLDFLPSPSVRKTMYCSFANLGCFLTPSLMMSGRHICMSPLNSPTFVLILNLARTYEARGRGRFCQAAQIRRDFDKQGCLANFVFDRTQKWNLLGQHASNNQRYEQDLTHISGNNLCSLHVHFDAASPGTLCKPSRK